MSRPDPRAIATLAVSTSLSLLAGWAYLHHRRAPEQSDLELVDVSSQVDAALEARRAAATASSGTTTPNGAPALFPSVPRPVRTPLDEETVKSFFPQVRPYSRYTFDPVAYFLHVPGGAWEREWPEHPNGTYRYVANDMGLLRPEPVRTERPDLRVLVLGDSHVEGVVSWEENLCAVLERRFEEDGVDAEVLNAAQGGTGPFNYLTVLERYASLEPDVVVAVLYCGNDFAGSVKLLRYFEGLGKAESRDLLPGLRKQLAEGHRSAAGQLLNQAHSLLDQPEEEALAVRAVVQTTVEMARVSTSIGAHFLPVALPSPGASQRDRYEAELGPALALFPPSAEPLRVEARMTAACLSKLKEAGLPALDLGPVLSAAPIDAFWHRDLHLSFEGHRIVGEALADELRKRRR